MREDLSEIELVTLEKQPQRASSPLPACEDTVRRQLSMNQEAGPHQTQNQPASFTLDFLASRSKFLLFIRHPVYTVFVVAA